MPLEALRCAADAERLRTGELQPEVVLSPDQMLDVYEQLQSLTRFVAVPVDDIASLHWSGMRLRQEAFS